MNNKEFKVKKFKETTVYTLESATAGGTSAGSVASVSKSMGGVQRRTGDNFFTQEDTTPIKPRRGPLKPHTGGGSHKDRTKTIPRKDKHRKKPMDMSEGRHEFDKKTGQMGYTTTDADQRHGLYINGKLVKTYNSREACDNIKKRDPKFKDATIKKIAEAKADPTGSWVVHNGTKVVKFKTHSGAKAYAAKNGGEVASSEYYADRIQKKSATAEQIAEDHEIQMASSELLSISKNAKNLLNLVQQYSERDGLEAWQQSKITRAADYLNSVLQAVNGEQYATEGHTIMPGFDKERYQPRQGLEGPFHTRSGKVVYYDPREGKYYDPDSDFHISHDDWQAMNEQDVVETIIRTNKQGIKKKSLKVNEVSRRGFLKGMGAAAVTAATPGGISNLAKAVTGPSAAAVAEPIAAATPVANSILSKLFHTAADFGMENDSGENEIELDKKYAEYQGITGSMPYGDHYETFKTPKGNWYLVTARPDGYATVISYIKNGEARAIISAQYDGSYEDAIATDEEDEDLWHEWNGDISTENLGTVIDSIINGGSVEPVELKPELEPLTKSVMPKELNTARMGVFAKSLYDKFGNLSKSMSKPMSNMPNQKISALPAPTTPEFDLTPDIKQKEKVPVGKNNKDSDKKDSYMEHLSATLSEKLDPNAPVDAWIDDFQKADPEKYHQFRQNNRPGTNKTPEYKERMAKAASYAAKTNKRT
jgi:hypothetical protein